MIEKHVSHSHCQWALHMSVTLWWSQQVFSATEILNDAFHCQWAYPLPESFRIPACCVRTWHSGLKCVTDHFGRPVEQSNVIPLRCPRVPQWERGNRFLAEGCRLRDGANGLRDGSTDWWGCTTVRVNLGETGAAAMRTDGWVYLQLCSRIVFNWHWSSSVEKNSDKIKNQFSSKLFVTWISWENTRKPCWNLMLSISRNIFLS